MYRFSQQAVLDLSTYPDPGPARVGPPLSQGFVLVLISTVAAEYCTPELRHLLAQVDPNAWYHGEVLEGILSDFEARDPALPAEIGKNIYYTLRGQFLAMGLRTPADVIRTIPMIWQHVTRGDSGEWRTELLGPGRARLEVDQPYNCRFEEGAVQGALEAFDAYDVRIEHSACARNGAPFCIFNVTWRE